jgi:uncharacterized protein with ParB-like and HNH nuclease domain
MVMKIITAKEASKPFTREEKKRHREQEASYRRGYRHGYDQALDDAKEGTTNYHYKFFNKVLMPWTYFKDKLSKKGKIMVFPPSIEGEVK